MILKEIAERTAERVAAEKSKLPLSEMRAMARDMDADTAFPFTRALCGGDIAFICEVKRASPSKGLIAPDFPYLQIAREYAEAGAAAISVLTEPFYFKGCDDYLREISGAVETPVLRKDFTVDEYMIYQAKTIGADAVLLITALLSKGQLEEYTGIARELGLSALVEVHDEAEMDTAIAAGAEIIGVNNRDLRDFTVDINTSARLRSLAPADKIFVSESGIKTADDIARLRERGVNAVLIGETLMRAADKCAEIARLRGERA